VSLLIKGVANFLALTDTPASYAGEAAKVAAVNAGEDALEFIDPPEHATAGITCVEPQILTLTANNVWEDFNLDKLVPEGATGAVFHLINREVGAERFVGLRKKGSTDSYGGSMNRHSHSWAMVGLDENRKCQGRAEDHSYQDFLLVGYTGANFTFFTNGYNIVPAAKTVWVETDIATECPGAIAAIIEFIGHLDTTDLLGARKHGSTDDRHTGAYHMWMVVGLDANQHLDLYDEDWPTSPDAFNLIGYITAGVTMYTNAGDISPTADGTYKTRSLAGYLANPIIAFIELTSGAAGVDFAIRKNYICGDIYYAGGNHNFAIVHPNTPDAGLRIKLESDTIHLYLLGIG